MDPALVCHFLQGQPDGGNEERRIDDSLAAALAFQYVLFQSRRLRQIVHRVLFDLIVSWMSH